MVDYLWVGIMAVGGGSLVFAAVVPPIIKKIFPEPLGSPAPETPLPRTPKASSDRASNNVAQAMADLEDETHLDTRSPPHHLDTLSSQSSQATGFTVSEEERYNALLLHQQVESGYEDTRRPHETEIAQSAPEALPVQGVLDIFENEVHC